MTDIMTRPIYGLDIETDNSAGHGLNPAKSSVVSWALVGSDGLCIFRQSDHTEHGEEDLLHGLCEAISWLPQHAIIATWNGGAFDFPFLTVRAEVNRVSIPWQIKHREDREPKYDPTPPFKGVCRVEFKDRTKEHHDVAYSFDKVYSDLVGVKWSLKPMLEHRGIADPAVTALDIAGSGASEAPSHLLAAYNIHDAWGTMRLSDIARATVGEHNFLPALDSFRIPA